MFGAMRVSRGAHAEENERNAYTIFLPVAIDSPFLAQPGLSRRSTQSARAAQPKGHTDHARG